MSSRYKMMRAVREQPRNLMWRANEHRKHWRVAILEGFLEEPGPVCGWSRAIRSWSGIFGSELSGFLGI
jgi:hypothetical protein